MNDEKKQPKHLKPGGRAYVERGIFARRNARGEKLAKKALRVVKSDIDCGRYDFVGALYPMLDRALEWGNRELENGRQDVTRNRR